MKSSVTYTLEKYFPLQFFYIGLVGLAFSVPLTIVGEYWIALLLFIPSLVFVTMVYATKIDWAHQEIHDLMKVAGITIKKEIFTYTTPLKLTIKEVPMKQGLASRGSTSIIYFTKYRGYLVTAGGLHLILEYKSKAKVTRLMKELSEQMKLELELKDVEVL